MLTRRTAVCIAALIVSVVALGGFLAQQRAGADVDNPALRQLHDQLAALETRVQTLEALLGAVPSAAGRAGTLIPDEGFDPSVGAIPPTWRRGEINGLPFYTVPLGGTQPPASANRKGP